MKTKTILFISFILTAFAVTGCMHISSGPEASKNIVCKKYSIDAFSQINNQAPVSIVFTQGKATTVQADGPENYIEHLTVLTRDNTLYISMDKKEFSKLKNNKIIISVSSPELSGISQKGVGTITLKDTVKVNEISIVSDGVGSIQTDALIAGNVYVSQRGVGSIEMQGQAAKAKYHLDGVGSVKAQNMLATDVIVEQNGVGSVSCYASGTIDITTKGVGSVNYYGNPQVTSLHKSGIGSVNSK